MRRALLLSLSLVTACAPPVPTVTATLEGVPSGQPVSRGEFGAWAQANDQMTLVLEGVSATAQVACQLDGVAVGCALPVPTQNTFGIYWSRTKVGADTASIAVFVDGAEVGRWAVSRTVVDEGLSVCVANTEGEDEGLPLDRCKTLQPFGDRELPMKSNEAVVIRRAKFSLARGRTNINRVSMVPLNDGEPGTALFFVKNFELAGPGEVEFKLDTQASLGVGGAQTLSWPAGRVRNRVFTDLDPNRLPVRIRVGARAEVSRSLQPTTAQTLTAWTDESGTSSLVESLPLQLPAGAPMGLTVRLSPTELGARSVWPRITLRDASGERTDRIPFRFEGIAASACKLEVADVNLGAVLVGETRIARFPVKNVGQASCSALRIKRTPDWVQLEARPAPAPGETVEWTARFSPRQPGLLVGLIEVDGDAEGPTFADFTFRLETNVSR